MTESTPASGSSPGHLRLTDLHPAAGDFRREVLQGLAEEQKRLSSKYFYDAAGSRLFDQICELPEYYPTRTELAIMEDSVAEMADRVGPGARLVEFGSGSSLKTRLLLDQLESPAAYVPVDISRDHLMDAAGDLSRRYPGLEILPVCADFTEAFDPPRPAADAERTVVYFPGSTLGNFDEQDALGLLAIMGDMAGPGGGVLIGIDLHKDQGVLEAAYNDAASITEEFNKNLLHRINRELGGNFDPARFRHHAPYDVERRRIEMRLVSKEEQVVTIDGTSVAFRKGEHILTEYSHKYSLDGFAELAARAGLRVEQVWTDADSLFSVQYLMRA